MGKNLQATLINHDLRPAYYDDFHCLMGDCQLSCCSDPWRITFDRKDYLTLKGVKGSHELNECLSHSLRRIRRGPFSEIMFGEFDMSTGICPLLREDKLCMLQLEKGAQVQPRVCKVFPRVEEISFGYFERSLSPACEGVLELLWNLPEGVDFVSDPLSHEKQGTVVLPEGCPYSINQCQDIRSACIDILQMRQFTLPQRILFMGLMLKELVDGETDIPRWLAKTQFLANSPETLEHLQSFGSMKKPEMRALANNLHVLGGLDLNTPGLREMYEKIQRGLDLPVISIGVKVKVTMHSPRASTFSRYEAALARYYEQFGDREYFMENLMVTIFFHLHLPTLSSLEDLWKSYVKFCNVYSFYRFMSVMSCLEGSPGDKSELFQLIVQTSRRLLHDRSRQTKIVDELFQNESATLAHMAILLSI